MSRRQQLEAVYAASTGEVFAALVRTLTFRRWSPADASLGGSLPQRGLRYRHEFGGVLRAGRVVEVMRPIGVTLKEILHDPPCRVSLTLRWRIEPVADGTAVRLTARFRLNHAAVLRGRHWDRRLRLHFRRQFAFIARHLDRQQAEQNVI